MVLSKIQNIKSQINEYQKLVEELKMEKIILHEGFVTGILIQTRGRTTTTTQAQE